ncbi:inositol monophosphatase family protein [Jeotgalibacillus proteolyticus]|uniref:Inositol monophosphatase n=1 Tax=Jeotgalibacillus proteolyticus TaxID=2082395 RepID=A0A2S5GDB5_9BACL|nr:inositol monophosphatase family protein [Jeotgalibacillus proteolyticus]PPA70986.1 inositol monophosphatase [Jeotgalibacillus proteolyticus]
MEQTIQKAKAVASKIIVEAGKIAKEQFGKVLSIEEKGDHGDVVTEADYLAEKVIINELNRAFPDHQIQSEEAGNNGVESDWVWHVDPLDGTNNFAMGLPVFASSIALLYKDQPVLGVIYDPFLDRLFVSSLNEGSFCNGQSIELKKRDNVKRFTIGWIQGHGVQNEEQAVKLRQHIDVNCKRMIRLWAPTLAWAMLAKGDIDAIILYNSEGEDLYSGLLMVKEAGGAVLDFSGEEFQTVSGTPYFIACHPEHKDYVMELVHKGLNE